MKISVLVLCSTILLLAGCNEQSSSGSAREASLYSAPLAPELAETYRKGKSHGHAVGSFIKEAFE